MASTQDGAGARPTAPAPSPAPGGGDLAAGDLSAVVRSRTYLALLVMGALIGVPVSAVAFGFLALVHQIDHAVYQDLPGALGFHGEPTWWPVPVVGLSGVVVALAVRTLPGNGGHSPVDGLSASATLPVALPGVVLAAVATLSLGAVLGPEAPLIAIGSGLGVLAVRLARRDAPPAAQVVLAAAGSFAALSTVLGSPLVAALFMLEAAGLGGPTLTLVIVPGLLAAGLGSLVFIGLGNWSGLGTFSLAVPNLPTVAHPTPSELGWAVALGLAGAVAGAAVHRGGRWLRDRSSGRVRWTAPAAGLAVGALAVAFAHATGKPSSDLLFSGQTLVGGLISSAATWTVGALLALLALKGLAYCISLSNFRGGPIFPSLLLGAAGGEAASHLPGMSLVPAVAMGMGALCVAMLRLPVASVALPTILLSHDGLAVAPVVIVAVVVAFVAVTWIDPRRPCGPVTRGVAGPPPGSAGVPGGAVFGARSCG